MDTDRGTTVYLTLKYLQFAQKEERIILTYDKDFGELVVKDNRYPSCGIILFRLSRMDPSHMAGYIRDVIGSRKDWEGHFLSY